LPAQILCRCLVFQQLVRQVHRRQNCRIRLAHMQGLLDPVHSLVHQGAYLFHILRAFVRHQGILLAADAHRHFIRHVVLPFM